MVKIKLKYLLGAFFIVFALSSFFYDFIEVRIVERVTGVDNVEDVDNRNSKEVKDAFNKYIGTPQALVGVGNRRYRDWAERMGKTGAGVIPLLFSYGVLAVILLFIGTNYLYFKINGCNKRTIVPILLYWISFYSVTLWLNPIVNMCLFYPHLKAGVDVKKISGSI